MANDRTDGVGLPVEELNERYRSLFTHNPHAALSFDLRGRFTDVNPVAERISGYPRAELCAMDFTALIHPDDLTITTEVFMDAVNRVPRQHQARMIRRDGEVLDLNLTAIPVVVDGEVVGVHGIAEDVTERNRLGRELQRSQLQAQEASATKSLFLANMSHEVRTPLTSVLAAAELLRDADLDAHAEHLVHMIERSGEKLLRLVTDILDVSKMEAGTLTLEEDWFDLRELIAEIVEMSAEAAHGKGLDCSCRVSADLPDRLFGDAVRVSQVVTNLVDNAVKFTDSGRITLAVDVTPTESEETVEIQLQVEDTGIGIAPDQLAGLFDSFTQADDTDTRSYGGAGLGLAICRELVTLMSGSLRAQSVPGQGSTFTVVLPLRVR